MNYRRLIVYWKRYLENSGFCIPDDYLLVDQEFYNIKFSTHIPCRYCFQLVIGVERLIQHEENILELPYDLGYYWFSNNDIYDYHTEYHENISESEVKKILEQFKMHNYKS